MKGVLWGTSSNFWVCGWNPAIWTFKRNLFVRSFARYYLILSILQNEICNFGWILASANCGSEKVREPIRTLRGSAGLHDRCHAPETRMTSESRARNLAYQKDRTGFSRREIAEHVAFSKSIYVIRRIGTQRRLACSAKFHCINYLSCRGFGIAIWFIAQLHVL